MGEQRQRVQTAALERAKQSAEQRKRVRRIAQVNPRQPWVAEEELERRKAFEERLASVSGPRGGGRELVQGSTVDYQPVHFLSEGVRVARAVALVHVDRPGDRRGGSGFMISEHLLITNQHVIENEEDARHTYIEFNFELDAARRRTQTTQFFLDPDRCFLAAPESDLDFVIVAVGARRNGTGELATFGFCPLSDRTDKHAKGIPLNIVEHPESRPKVVVVRNNLLVNRLGRVLQYETDTDVGSSGSPVFNDAWDVVALHHWGAPFLERKGPDGEELPVNVNEGVRVSHIVERIKEEMPKLKPVARAVLDEALSLVTPSDLRSKRPQPDMFPERLERSGARVSVADVVPTTPVKAPPPSAATTPALAQPLSAATVDGDVRVTIPLEITVRLGGAQVGTAVQPLLPPGVAGPEKVVIDFDYSNREGYDSDFIEGYRISMPKPLDASVVAPLKGKGSKAKKGELLYQHFSVKMHGKRRMALFTATNIDGDEYVVIDRKTGLPKLSEASEKWYGDPRIDERYFIDQSFYSEWSTYFDRGHLTRRTDPTWGDEEDAIRANGDTFHFTNCTPQHFLFNQKARYWQGVERFILEKGAVERRKRLCVFTGPLLRGESVKCDDVHVPTKFWKVVAWEGKEGLKACAFLVTQAKLMDIERFGTKPPSGDTPLEVEHWRIRIEKLGELAALDFGDVVKHDTFPDPGPVGETQKPITSFDDLL